MAQARLRRLLPAYFRDFTYDGLRVHFAVDDIGNMAHYYHALARRLSSHGGLFSGPILTFAGLNPTRPRCKLAG